MRRDPTLVVESRRDCDAPDPGSNSLAAARPPWQRDLNIRVQESRFLACSVLHSTLSLRLLPFVVVDGLLSLLPSSPPSPYETLQRLLAVRHNATPAPPGGRSPERRRRSGLFCLADGRTRRVRIRQLHRPRLLPQLLLNADLFFRFSPQGFNPSDPSLSFPGFDPGSPFNNTVTPRMWSLGGVYGPFRQSRELYISELLPKIMADNVDQSTAPAPAAASATSSPRSATTRASAASSCPRGTPRPARRCAMSPVAATRARRAAVRWTRRSTSTRRVRPTSWFPSPTRTRGLRGTIATWAATTRPTGSRRRM